MLENVYFRDICQNDIEEIRNLHLEWFPLNYPDSFYDKILQKKNIIARGCFIKLENLEILLGTIISRVKIGCEDVININKHLSELVQS